MTPRRFLLLLLLCYLYFHPAATVDSLDCWRFTCENPCERTGNNAGIDLGLENDCGVSPPTLLGTSYTSLRCCSNRPVAKVTWFWSKHNIESQFKTFCWKLNNCSGFSIDSGRLSSARKYFNGFYRCRLQFEDGGSANATQLIVHPRETEVHQGAPKFESCGTKEPIKVSAGRTIKMDCVIKVSFKPNAAFDLRLFKDDSLVADCHLTPYCFRLLCYKNATPSCTGIHWIRNLKKSGHCNIDDSAGIGVALVGVGASLTIQLTFIRVESPFGLRIVAVQNAASSKQSINVTVTPRLLLKALSSLWKIGIVIISVTLVFGAISILLALRRDLRLLIARTTNWKLRCGPIRPPLQVHILCSETAGSDSAAFSEQLDAYLRRHLPSSQRFQIVSGPPLAGTPTVTVVASIAATAGATRRLVVVLLDDASLRSDLFVGQLKALLLTPAVWRIYVAMETLGQMMTAAKALSADAASFVARLKTDAKHRDLVTWRPIPARTWVMRQVCLCVELQDARRARDSVEKRGRFQRNRSEQSSGWI